jgi:hypothetical protein
MPPVLLLRRSGQAHYAKNRQEPTGAPSAAVVSQVTGAGPGEEITTRTAYAAATDLLVHRCDSFTSHGHRGRRWYTYRLPNVSCEIYPNDGETKPDRVHFVSLDKKKMASERIVAELLIKD